MKKLLIMLLAILIALFFIACNPEDNGDTGDTGDTGDGGTPGEALQLNFEEYTATSTKPGEQLDSSWTYGVETTYTGTAAGPRVKINVNTPNNSALMISEYALGSGAANDWGTAYTGYSYATYTHNCGDLGGTLTFNYSQLGWDSAGSAAAPNYGPVQFFIDAPSDLSNPGTPDWSNNEQTGFTNPGQDDYAWNGTTPAITIPAGTHSFTWRAQKTSTTYDEDSYWIDNIIFTPNTAN